MNLFFNNITPEDTKTFGFWFTEVTVKNVIWEWKSLCLSWEGINNALKLAIRLMLLVMGPSILTLTTTPIELTDAIESLLKPLALIRFPVHSLAMIMSMALRLIPTIMEETDKIILAQKARCADFESRNLFKKVKALLPILIPLFVSGIRRADELAFAMDSRCYRGAKGRTKYKKQRLTFRDLIGTLLTAGLIVSICVVFNGL